MLGYQASSQFVNIKKNKISIVTTQVGMPYSYYDETIAA